MHPAAPHLAALHLPGLLQAARHPARKVLCLQRSRGAVHRCGIDSAPARRLHLAAGGPDSGRALLADCPRERVPQLHRPSDQDGRARVGEARAARHLRGGIYQAGLLAAASQPGGGRRGHRLARECARRPEGWRPRRDNRTVHRLDLRCRHGVRVAAARRRRLHDEVGGLVLRHVARCHLPRPAEAAPARVGPSWPAWLLWRLHSLQRRARGRGVKHGLPDGSPGPGAERPLRKTPRPLCGSLPQIDRRAGRCGHRAARRPRRGAGAADARAGRRRHQRRLRDPAARPAAGGEYHRRRQPGPGQQLCAQESKGDGRAEVSERQELRQDQRHHPLRRHLQLRQTRDRAARAGARARSLDSRLWPAVRELVRLDEHRSVLVGQGRVAPAEHRLRRRPLPAARAQASL
mmetsp:Transcript_4526/g.15009  ORF Transcript_4526/g.15009 Transcript_4526/m.15009 type:complete len:405 (+) Transcript_4526:652-1866(+)